MGGLWAAYLAALQRRPVLTKGLTSGSLWAAADLVAQAEAQRRAGAPSFAWNPVRSAGVFAYGLALSGPLGHYWYALLEAKVLRGRTRAPQVLAAVALDQALATPWFLFMFFSASSAREELEAVLRAESALARWPVGARERLDARLRDEYWTKLRAGWAIWGPVALLNFFVTPPPLRIPFNGFVSFCFNLFLSLTGRSRIEPTVGSSA
jgi:hypothetical protein